MSTPPIPASHAIIATAADDALAARAVALAATLGIPHAETQIRDRRRELAVVPIPNGEGTTTITAVHEYASFTRAQYVAATPPPPGENPAAITDAQIIAALEALIESGAITRPTMGA